MRLSAPTQHLVLMKPFEALSWNRCCVGGQGVFDTLLGPERTHAASLLGGQSVVLVVPDRFEVIPQA
jgi:hypothetical protein